MKERKILIAAILIVTIFGVSIAPTVRKWWKKDAGVTAEAGVKNGVSESENLELFSISGPNYNIHKDRTKELGTAENPFIVLEIVPFEGYAEVGYLIGGCEPIDFEKVKYTDIKGDLATIVGRDGNVGIYCEEEVEFVDFYDESNESVYPNLSWEAQCYGYFEKTAPGAGDYTVSGSFEGKSLSFQYCKTGGDYTWVLKDSAPETVYEGYTDVAWTTVSYTKHGTADTKSINVSYGMSTSERIYSMNIRYHVNVYHYRNRDFFLRNSLVVPEADIPNYHIQVVTVTPETLNANLSLIDATDWFVISCKAHVANVLSLWERYYDETKFAPSDADLEAVRNGTISGGSRTFAENDLSWEATVAILKKISPPYSFEEYAPLVADIGIYDNASGYGSPYAISLDGSIRKFASGGSSSFNTTGVVNNIFKLYLMTQNFDTDENGYFYKNYIETGLITTRTVNGITTGCYQPLIDKYGTDQKVIDLATYWNKYTFLDIEGSYWEQEKGESWNDFAKKVQDSHKVLFFDEQNGSHNSVRNGVFTYNGDTPMCQRWGSTYIDTTWDDEIADTYHKEPFSIMEFADQKTLTTEEIVYYLLHRNATSVDVEINGSKKNKIYSNVDYDVQNADTALVGEIITKEDGQLYGRVHFNISLQSHRAVESTLIKLDIYQEDFYDDAATPELENLVSFTEAYNKDGEMEAIKLEKDYYFDIPLKLLSRQSTEDLKFTVTIWYRYKSGYTDKTDSESYLFEKVLYEYKTLENGSVVDNRRTLTFVRRAMFNLD